MEGGFCSPGSDGNDLQSSSKFFCYDASRASSQLLIGLVVTHP